MCCLSVNEVCGGTKAISRWSRGWRFRGEFYENSYQVSLWVHIITPFGVWCYGVLSRYNNISSWWWWQFKVARSFRSLWWHCRPVSGARGVITRQGCTDRPPAPPHAYSDRDGQGVTFEHGSRASAHFSYIWRLSTAVAGHRRDLRTRHDRGIKCQIWNFSSKT